MVKYTSLISLTSEALGCSKGKRYKVLWFQVGVGHQQFEMLSYTPQKCGISYRNKTAYPIAISMTPFKPGNATIIFKSLHFASISLSCFSLWLYCMKYHRKICVKTSSANHISKGCGCLCPGQSAVGTAVCKSSKKSGIFPLSPGS